MFEHVIRRTDEAHRRACAADLDLLRSVADIDRVGAWEDAGARDAAHWLSMRYGISEWKARRWIVAGHALQSLPVLCDALAAGALGIDKVVELSRFATLETESRLVAWARGVSCAAVRRRADLETRPPLDEVVEAERARTVSWWYLDDGRRFGLEAELPAAQGAIVAKALERVAETIPTMPGEEERVDARRADALVALCSSRIASDAEPDRATVVVHARTDALAGAGGGCEIEDGPVIHPETARRFLCNARAQGVVEAPNGDVLAVGRMSRQPSAWMIRQIRYRDHGCRFPGCGSRRFTEAHHIVWWRDGGRTDLNNLTLICSFHHRLVHEYGWRLHGTSTDLRWYRPDGVRYRAGPSPTLLRTEPAADVAV